MNRGIFITFEGGEGSGKSTQIKLLSDALTKANVAHVLTREPGGVESAERIRELLVSGKTDAWLPETETLLFYAARLEHVRRLITPAMEAGTHVLCDRFADSTLVYQGFGKGMSDRVIRNLHVMMVGNFGPDLTFMLDIDPEEGLRRTHARAHGETRFEAMDLDFHRRVRDGFLSLAARDPHRCVVMDAGQDKNTIHQKVMEIVSERLNNNATSEKTAI